MSETAQGAAAKRLSAVLERMAGAARRAGRDPAELTLVAVSKTRPPADLQTLIDCGQQHFGENYLQEALPKIGALQPHRLTWHFIGQLQSNKTAPVAEYFDWVHTVDRLKLVQRLAAQRPFHAPPLNVCVQVKLGDEPGKGGATVGDLPALLEAVARQPQLRLRGLMTLPPAESAEADQRRWFAALREVFQQMQRQHPAMDTLSMGMSGDLEAAILEGATMIRIGTALFGERLQSQA
ncbi:MAG: YggS family pyridoxal phosphate-dependent enzyme [Gammaproteobacteria bacterium]|nr:YggS family pyridoxal phosphate-dependent enzyme [Gammaproteobacteria bacterium]